MNEKTSGSSSLIDPGQMVQMIILPEGEAKVKNMARPDTMIGTEPEPRIRQQEEANTDEPDGWGREEGCRTG